jgi:hypothetical protein
VRRVDLDTRAAVADLVRIGWTYEDVEERWSWLPLDVLIVGTCRGTVLASADIAEMTVQQFAGAKESAK